MQSSKTGACLHVDTQLDESSRCLSWKHPGTVQRRAEDEDPTAEDAVAQTTWAQLLPAASTTPSQLWQQLLKPLQQKGTK